MESTILSEEEIQRRESYFRADQRPYVWYDPHTWTYPARTALSAYVIAIGAITGGNLMQKRPWHYGFIPRAGGSILAAVLGYYIGKLRAYNMSTRDAVVEHYMSLHPSDFEQMSSRYGRPYSSILLPWIPRRAQQGNYKLDEET